MNVATLERPVRPYQDPRGTSVQFTPAQAQELLRTKFAPWVQDLGLIVESCSASGARLRLPFSARLTRVGDTLCGQAMMACADTAMALAICSAFGAPTNITTIGQTISFMRPVAQDLIIEASVQKRGRSLIFSEASFVLDGANAMAAHATATWALIP
jgi:uncharacterized protein (TIGR00369 family)